MLDKCYCEMQEWLQLLYRIIGTENPFFDLPSALGRVLSLKKDWKDMDTKDGSVFGDCVTRIAKALKLKPGSETLIATQLQELHPFAKHLLDSNEVGSSREAWAKATCLKLENMKKTIGKAIHILGRSRKPKQLSI